MTVISETRERFLRAITGVIPAERVIEIHFFAPIRQGGVESGVAVIAAAMEVHSAVEATAPDAAVPKSSVLDDAPVALGSVVYADRAPEDDAGDLLEDSLPPALLAHAAEVCVSDVAEEEAGDSVAGPAPPRYTVYSAKYRLVLKGVERGKWETQIVAEADAPLLTVETVVRGVQRRSGDLEGPERMHGEEVRARVGMMVNAR